MAAFYGTYFILMFHKYLVTSLFTTLSVICLPNNFTETGKGTLINTFFQKISLTDGFDVLNVFNIV